MAKQKTEIARTVEMYVQKMNLAQDTTAVAAQLAASAGAVGKSAVDNMVAQKQAETAANTAAAKARTDAIRARQADVLLKRAALQKAEIELKAAQLALADAEARNADAGTLNTLRDKVATKQISLDEARIDLQTSEAAVTAAKNFDRPTSDENKDAPKETVRSVPGPVVYRIVENPKTGGIALERVNFKLFSLSKGSSRVINSGSQLDFQTWGKKPASDTSVKPEPGKTKIPQVTGPSNLTLNKFSGVFSQIVQFDTELKKPLTGELQVSDGQGTDQKKWLKVAASGTNSVTLTWDKDTPNGTYAVILPILFKDDRMFPSVLTVEVK
jgi:hypothetical protein